MIKPKATIQRDLVEAEIERRGLSCIQQGKAWHVFGMGVDIVTVDLQNIDVRQLQPVTQALE